MKGKIYGIGIGPGDPELLSLKAHRLLQEVAVVCVPKSRSEGSSTALSIVAKFLSPKVEVLELNTPMTRDPMQLQKSWGEAAKQVLERLQQGKDAAFLTLGDSMLYSTYAYLMKEIQEQDPEIEIVSVPGITSFAACAASLNLPLALGEEALAVVPVPSNPRDLIPILKLFPNLVLMKAGSRLEDVIAVLKEEGLGQKAILAQRCGMEGERIYTSLEEVRTESKEYFSLILVKKGVAE